MRYCLVIETEDTTMNRTPNMTSENPRMTIVWQVLEAAKDAKDGTVIAACRRLIVANRLGWNKHADATDFRLVQAFYA